MNVLELDVATKPEESLFCNGNFYYGKCYKGFFHKDKKSDEQYVVFSEEFPQLMQNPHAFLVRDPKKRYRQKKSLTVRIIFIGKFGQMVAEVV